MRTVEILAGGNFANAVEALGLTSAKCTYRYSPPKESFREDYQVWLLSEEDYKSIDAIDDEGWQDNWGWWRWSEGSNMGGADQEYIIHGEKLLAWDGIERQLYVYDCAGCSDHAQNRCAASEKDQLECYGIRQYADLLSYFWNEIGASTERNICALAVDLAHQNGMTMAELFTKYLGV